MKEKINRICQQNYFDFVFSFAAGKYTATVLSDNEVIEWFEGENEKEVLTELLTALNARINNGN